MKIKEALPIIKKYLHDECGIPVQDFRLEELYPLKSSGIQPITISYLIPENEPVNTSVASVLALNPPYIRMYKKIDFNMTTGKITQMRMFAE